LGENTYGVVRNDHDDHSTDGVPTDAQEFTRNTTTRSGGEPQRPVPDPPEPGKCLGIITATIVSDAELSVVKETEDSVWRCGPLAFTPISQGKIRSIVAPIQLNRFMDRHGPRKKTFHDGGPQHWKKATTNQQEIEFGRETRSVRLSLVEGNGRFLPNPGETTYNCSRVPIETRRDAEPPICNAADRDYGGEEATRPTAQPRRIKRRELTIRRMWCCTKLGAQRRPIQTFPRCAPWSAIKVALSQRCDIGAVLRNFCLLTGEERTEAPKTTNCKLTNH
jgi:hypothetical protein